MLNELARRMTAARRDAPLSDASRARVCAAVCEMFDEEHAVREVGAQARLARRLRVADAVVHKARKGEGLTRELARKVARARKVALAELLGEGER